MGRNLATAIGEISDPLIPAAWRRNSVVFRQAKRDAIFGLTFLFWGLMFAGVYALLGAYTPSLITLWAVLPILASLAALERGYSPAACGHLLCGTGWLVLTMLGIVTGGWTGIPPMLWFTGLPVVAVLTAGRWAGVVWTVVPLATLAGFATAQAAGVSFPQELPPAGQKFMGYALVAGLVVYHLVAAWIRVGIEQRALGSLQRSKKNLAKVRQELQLLQSGLGFSVKDWERLKREKAALDYFVQRRFGIVAAEPNPVAPPNDEQPPVDGSDPRLEALDKAAPAGR